MKYASVANIQLLFRQLRSANSTLITSSIQVLYVRKPAFLAKQLFYTCSTGVKPRKSTTFQPDISSPHSLRQSPPADPTLSPPIPLLQAGKRQELTDTVHTQPVGAAVTQSVLSFSLLHISGESEFGEKIISLR